MKDGNWFLKISVQITGENSIGETIESGGDIKISLIANDEVEAEKEARIILTNKKIRNSIVESHFGHLENDDEITFSNPSLCFELQKAL